MSDCDPMDCSLQAPLSMGFSRQGYRNGFLCPSLGYLSNPGTEPMSLMSPALAGRKHHNAGDPGLIHVAWWATVQRGHRKIDMTEHINT